MQIRKDASTGKEFTWFNIPISSKKTITTCVQNAKGYFKVFSSTHNNPEDSWYNERFVGCRWAVFVWNARMNAFQQSSIWYERFGNAEKKLLEIGKC